MSFLSALYAGEVVHARSRPSKHRLRYRVFSLLLDLDELLILDRTLRMFGHNRWAIFSFHDADHGDGETGGLKTWVAGRLSAAGIKTDDLKVRMLCYPRIFGYVFNPLTVYFCEKQDGTLLAILYEVCNTFHERHTYIIPAQGKGADVSHSCAKELYVSPFMPMDCRYDFRIRPPGEKVRIAIDESDGEGHLLFASFSGERREISDGALLKSLLTYPLMTLKVMGAIHWEALRLWMKGVPVHRHLPAAKSATSSVVSMESEPRPQS
ncbi:DUF1365 domain-containing protein [Rhizobium sp. XQZ8]|uniref:DUF1365 domain-containing protein n=1 Tax=Rhizobium populisoli TaxID=2859785 RepID=UPI001C670B02|nr:DUF1365 domain-containing protein [Rhizobium populisoli]MBW6424475.1 DUF1365 domain-containing protein [Rhizobium populisoli]